MPHNRLIAYASLALAFALLWVPLGQHPFLVLHWMKIGAFAAPFVLLTAAYFRREDDGAVLRDLRVLSVLMLATYILHQVEEHWVDFTGTTYAFHGYVNALLRNAVAAPENAEFITQEAIFVINSTLVWFVGALAVILSPPRLFPALCMASIMIVNAISHIGAAFSTGSYNPGLATAIFALVPVAAWTFWVAKQQTSELIIASLLWALLAHVVMIGGTLGAMWANIYPETLYFAMLLATALLPALLYSQRQMNQSREL